MMVTITGYDDDGQIFLEETPPVKTRTGVMVTFLTEETTVKKQVKRKLGGLEGKVALPGDFNEPLDDLKVYMQK